MQCASETMVRFAAVFAGSKTLSITPKGTAAFGEIWVNAWPCQVLILGNRENLQNFGVELLAAIRKLPEPPEPATPEQAAIYREQGDQ